MSKTYIPKKIRKIVFERANGCCEYCQAIAKFVPDTFQIEHIIPETKDGESDLTNLALACQGCNSVKYHY